MEIRGPTKFQETVVVIAYLIGLVAFITYTLNLYSTGVAVGLFHLTPKYMSENPNAVKWVVGAFMVMFVLTKGGTGMWCALLYLAVRIVEDTSGHIIADFVALAAIIMGFFVQFCGEWGYHLLLSYANLGPLAPKPPPEKQEGLQIANEGARGGKKAVVKASAFDNLIGVDKAIKEFRDALELPLVHPELVKKYNIEPTRGIILYGPPGTGKTSLARAVAEYFNVPFIYQKATAFSGEYVGTTEANVRRLFEQARKLAAEKRSRVIIFLDEIDAIARKRDGGHRNRPSDLVLNPLLEELDGFKKENSIFLIAATNRLDVLDEAILRPGRLDKHIEIGYPDLKARKELFRLYLKGVPLCEGDEIEANFDALMDECARKHEVISPADIKEICQRVKVRAAARQAQTESVGIKAEDLRKEMEAWVPARAG
jgi:AAA+ superfamily predicted ATPase